MQIFNYNYEINWGSLPDWLILIVTILGILIALRQFVQYRKEIKTKTFIEFRQRFKTDPINLKVLEYLSVNNSSKKAKPSSYEVNHFFGFYDELHKMVKDNLISLEDVIYYFGNYYLKVFTKEELISFVKIQSNYWSRALDLYCLIKEKENKILTKVKKAYKHKKNVNSYNKK